MKVAITGASGFLGRYIAKELVASGHFCRGFTRSAERRGDPNSQVEWVVGSMSDPAAIDQLVAGMDAVVHAALDHPSGKFLESDIDVSVFVDRNLGGTLRLIVAAQNAGVDRFVVISSGAVHDDILRDRPLDEAHPLWPKSHYGATKAAIEAFVHSFGRGDQFPICALRPTSIYGCAEPLEASRWYDLVASVVRNEDVICQRGAKQVHALDVARATQLLLTSKDIAGEIYQCTDRFVAERDVGLLAQSIAGTHGAIEGEPPVNRNPISSEKLKRLGMTFGSEVLLKATIEEMVWTIQQRRPMGRG